MNDNGLHAALIRDYTRDAPTKVYVALNLGNEEVGCWDVTERSAEYDEQPGDYWGARERENHEQDFADKFVADKLRAALGFGDPS